MNAFLIAAHVTTSDMISNAILWLLKQPEHWQALCREPQLAPRLIDEVMRRDSPVPGMMRVATEDMIFKGDTEDKLLSISPLLKHSLIVHWRF